MVCYFVHCTLPVAVWSCTAGTTDSNHMACTGLCLATRHIADLREVLVVTVRTGAAYRNIYRCVWKSGAKSDWPLASSCLSPCKVTTDCHHGRLLAFPLISYRYFQIFVKIGENNRQLCMKTCTILSPLAVTGLYSLEKLCSLCGTCWAINKRLVKPTDINCAVCLG
jgi:hypothetical protein